MRHSTLVFTIAILSLVLLTPTAWAKDSGCKEVEGTLELTFTVIWKGPAWVVIGDQLFTGQVRFVTESIKETDDGNFVGTETGSFTFGRDTFTEVDQFTFGPSDEDPEVWHYNAVGRITEGKGKFKDAYGKLVLQGTAAFDGGATARVTLKGRMCDIGE